MTRSLSSRVRIVMRPGRRPEQHDRLLGVDDEVQHHLLQLGHHRQHVLLGRVLDAQLDVLALEAPLPELGDRRDDVGQPDRRGVAGLLPREQREVADDAAGAGALLLNQDEIALDAFRHVGLHLQQLGEAENRLQRVVDLVRDAGHELADGRQPLLPDHLPLQRLQLLADAPLLAHLRVERRARFVEAAQHLIEGALQLLELARRHRLAFDRAEVAGGDALRGAVEVAERLRQASREHQRDEQPAGQAERQDREAARPERHRPVERHRGRDADADEPRAAADPRSAVHPADAVEGRELRRRTRLRRRLPEILDAADVAVRVQAAGDHAAVARR